MHELKDLQVGQRRDLEVLLKGHLVLSREWRNALWRLWLGIIQGLRIHSPFPTKHKTVKGQLVYRLFLAEMSIRGLEKFGPLEALRA